MKIKQSIPNLMTDGGIFKYIPLYGENTTAIQMGVVYGTRSGDKTISALVENYSVNDVVTSSGERAIGEIITAIYKEQWDRIYNALIEDYAPLENYNMTEEETDEHTGKDSVKREIGERKGKTEMGSRQDSAQNNIKAFNSGSFVDTDKNTANIGAQDTNYTNNEAVDNDETTYNSKLERKTRRFGNLGVTTSQQMLQSELDLRVYNFYEKIFNDIDSYLTIPVYEW